MLLIHRAERADALVGLLGDLLEQPLDDPMAREVISVPTRGIERWLSQQLSLRLGASPNRGDGVCANIDFPFPGALVTRAVAAAQGLDGDRDPWAPERCVWPLLEVIEESLGEAWLGLLAAHLGATGAGVDSARRARRFGVARHIADLFDRYGVHRPEMMRAWAAGEDVGGLAQPLAAGASWQAELWRRLRDRVAEPSPAERLEASCALLRTDGSLVDLPSRLCLFGLTRLPRTYLEVLRALAAHREVHLFLLYPSPVLWARSTQVASGLASVTRRAEDPTADLPRNALLASWGRDAREMQVVLAAAGAERGEHRPVDEPATTLLRRIQADIRADRAPPGFGSGHQEDARALLPAGDRSLQVHACHGRSRQVEVLRDAILHLLAGDPSLEPRDIIVMCPDIEEFAPLIQATFGTADGTADGSGDEDDAGGPRLPGLPVRLADRSLRQTNALLGVIAELLDLAGGRVTVSQVLDLAGRDPVRRRFGFDDTELALVKEWVTATGARWGLDGADRVAFGLHGMEGGTWRAAMDRILLGVTMADEDERIVGGVVPYDDIGSSSISLAGRFAEFIDRLGVALGDLRRSMPITGWIATLSGAADALTSTVGRAAWQRSQLDRILAGVAEEAVTQTGPSRSLLTLVEVRALLGDRLRGRPTRANFRTGHLTVCTLVPMRSVPHRVVCLLGLDDGAFPRHVSPDGDDITQADPLVGDRDARSEDRQLLLDALLAATDCLVITYTGHDERTNAPRSPAVPVGELLDVVDRTARLEGGGLARTRVVVHHPLQPFDPRAFTPGSLIDGRPWSFDPVALGGARALLMPRRGKPAFLEGPLPDLASNLLELDDLMRFVENPVKAFLRARLAIRLTDVDDEASDALPIELNHLELWGVGQHLLRARLDGADPEACLRAESSRGLLPPGPLGASVLAMVTPVVETIVAEASKLAGAARRESVQVDVALGGGRRLVGSLPDVTGDLALAASYSRLAPKQRLAAWVRYLALVAAQPERPFQAVTIGKARFRPGRPGTVSVARVGPFPGNAAQRRTTALAHLSLLVDLYDRGMREPLPIYCDTSAAYVAALAAGKDALSAAAGAWVSAWNFPREDKSPENLLVLGGERTLGELMAETPRDDEVGAGWDAAETSRFGRYARRLWDGLLVHEELADL